MVNWLTSGIQYFVQKMSIFFSLEIKGLISMPFLLLQLHLFYDDVYHHHYQFFFHVHDLPWPQFEMMMPTLIFNMYSLLKSYFICNIQLLINGIIIFFLRSSIWLGIAPAGVNSIRVKMTRLRVTLTRIESILTKTLFPSQINSEIRVTLTQNGVNA